MIAGSFAELFSLRDAFRWWLLTMVITDEQCWAQLICPLPISPLIVGLVDNSAVNSELADLKIGWWWSARDLMGNIFRHFTGWASSCHGNRCRRRLPNRFESFFFDKQHPYFHRLFWMRGFDHGSLYLTSCRAVLAWSLSPMRRLSQSSRWTCFVFS